MSERKHPDLLTRAEAAREVQAAEYAIGLGLQPEELAVLLDGES